MAINRKELVLEQITEEEYATIKTAIKKTQYVFDYPTLDMAFARIKSPLIFESYEHLLMEFKNTGGARNASVNLAPRNWKRVSYEELNTGAITELCDIAGSRGFLYLSFCTPMHKPDTNNEIGF